MLPTWFWMLAPSCGHILQNMSRLVWSACYTEALNKWVCFFRTITRPMFGCRIRMGKHWPSLTYSIRGGHLGTQAFILVCWLLRALLCRACALQWHLRKKPSMVQMDQDGTNIHWTQALISIEWLPRSDGKNAFPLIINDHNAYIFGEKPFQAKTMQQHSFQLPPT